MKFVLRGGVAVLTGAASGIGRATAVALAERGCHLALVDRDAEGLAETARQAAARDVRVSQHVLDVTDQGAVDALPATVLTEHGRATILINNAGVSLVGRFEELTMEEFRWLVEINLFAVVALTKAFLPVLREQAQAQVVNISSLFGIIAPAEQSAYVASKFAVRGFSESLRHELEDSSVGVTVVHPGGVKTAIAKRARVAAAVDPETAAAATTRFTDLALRMSPEDAAAALVNAIEKRQRRLLIGSDARAADLLQRAMPGRYWSLLRRAFERLRVKP